jgi:hypothetical protein
VGEREKLFEKSFSLSPTPLHPLQKLSRNGFV